MERLTVLAPGPSLTAADVQQFCLAAVVEDLPDAARFPWLKPSGKPSNVLWPLPAATKPRPHDF